MLINMRLMRHSKQCSIVLLGDILYKLLNGIHEDQSENVALENNIYTHLSSMVMAENECLCFWAKPALRYDLFGLRQYTRVVVFFITLIMLGIFFLCCFVFLRVLVASQ